MSIRVYIVEDHPVMRATLQDYLTLSPDIELCGMAGSAEIALADLDTTQPSVILLDLALPGRSGLDLLEEIQARWRIPCLILSGHGERSYVGRAFAAGARGYVLKGSPAELPTALRRVAGGEVYLSSSLRRVLDLETEESGA